MGSTSGRKVSNLAHMAFAVLALDVPKLPLDAHHWFVVNLAPSKVPTPFTGKWKPYIRFSIVFTPPMPKLFHPAAGLG
jgi:hypothetical protein